MSNYDSVSASGYKSIRNAIDNDKFIVHDELIDEHRCNALTPRISDGSLFKDFGPCDSKIYLRHRAKGIQVQGMGRNSEIKSTTPQECTTELTAGNYAVSQQKVAGIDIIDKCNFDSFWDNVKTKRDWVFDDFIDRQALMMISSVNPCVIDKCGNLQTGTSTAPLDINVTNSHEIFSHIQNARFANCDGRPLIMTFPNCFRGVLTGNTEFAEQFRNCCSLDTPQFTGNIPMINNIKVEFSPFVPYIDCGDGTKVYTISVFPEGAFGYASLVAHMEQINTDANIKHYSFAERLILKYAMGIADPSDYLNLKVKFTIPPLATTTCGV